MAEKLTFEKILALFAQTDAKIAELAVESKKTSAQMRETDAELKARFAETDAKMRKTDAQIEKVSKQLGGMGNNTGEVTEEYFADALAQKMTFAGMQFDSIARNVNLHKGNLQDEFDIVMYNGNSVALIEAKYKAHEKDLDRLVTSKVQNFRTFFPHYANYKIYLGLASMAFYDELIEHAKELGVGILKQHGDTVEFSTETVRAY